ncbi:DNA-dependent RNA polymerase [Achlya hypogyna]|uniref:DNA-directed RNA polymerase n=1 Tax=Achlya hypogyna TaxID=1202772 RepID=A0A1V9ZL07_ACHHY|nr:DNA-dependent RNA polymerase [Achlya hypogyna]
MQAARLHVRRWLSVAKPAAAVSRSSALLPRWQQRQPQQMLRHNTMQQRMKSSIPAMQRLEDDCDDDSDDEGFEALPKHSPLEKADWFERSLSVAPMPQRYKRPRKPVTPWDATLHEDDQSSSIPSYTPSEKDETHRLGAMSPEEVDSWLEGFEIPAEAAKLTGKTAYEVRELYAKQLRLEQAIYEMSVDTNTSTMTSVAQLSMGSQVGSAKSYIIKWGASLTSAILDEIADVSDGDTSVIDRSIYGPALYLIAPEKLARIVVTTVLNHVLMEADGVKFVKITLALGKEIQEEIKKESLRSRSNLPAFERQYARIFQGNKRSNIRARAMEYFETVGDWSKELQLKLGSALLDLLEKNCYEEVAAAPESGLSHLSEDRPETPSRVKAFMHTVRFEKNRRYGIIRASPEVYAKIMNGDVFLPWCARYLPMVVPPRPWQGVANGGYLTLPTTIMRHRDSRWQLQCAKRGEMDPVVRSLNMLADIPWVINRDVLNVVMAIWNNGGGFGDLPPRDDLALPEEPNPEAYTHIADEADRLARYNTDVDTYKKTLAKIVKKNREFHSLRCDTIYKLQVAEEFQHEEALYFPYNMDFRGRVYPIPPNLNHLGSDMSRSLLVFKDKKPLGPGGLRWLKIHLANLYGIDKCSFDDRERFSTEHMQQILASAADPLGDHPDCKWWRDAEAPFLALGVVFELAKAMQHPNPEEYLCNLPVHQDGSCNGLQHYAALGRDQGGGEQVNLVPSDKPQDVYSGVAARVIARMEQDAVKGVPSLEEIIDDMRPSFEQSWHEDALVKQRRSSYVPKKALTREESLVRLAKAKEFELKRRHEYANLLLKSISRKVVKQTVMTSVYGVTYIGARRQIQARLEEVFLLEGRGMDEELEEQIYHAANYAAELTMQSMGDLFTSARLIMEWLSKCTELVANEGQMMSWITPLGLPVTQPYRVQSSKQVRTSMQHVIIADNDSKRVSVGRQKSAFPPNYVHSLDSTHMMMTSLKVIGEDGLDFAAVHDSYWTHACNVDRMNQRLREEFVALYSQPLLEELRDQLVMRFPRQQFPPVPEVGQLDLTEVLESPYFFN